MTSAAVDSQRESERCITWGKSLWSVPGFHVAYMLLILACLKYFICICPQGHLNTGGGLHQMHTLFLKQRECNSTGLAWDYLNSVLKNGSVAERAPTLCHAFSWMLIANNEQPWLLLVPAWPPTDQASCITRISTGTMSAQKGLQKTSCSH